MREHYLIEVIVSDTNRNFGEILQRVESELEDIDGVEFLRFKLIKKEEGIM